MTTDQKAGAVFNLIKEHFDLTHGSTLHYSIQFQNGNWSFEIDVTNSNQTEFLIALSGEGATLAEAFQYCIAQYDGCSVCDR